MTVVNIRYQKEKRVGPNLEPGTMRVYLMHGTRNGLNIGRKVGPCPIARRLWGLGNAQAVDQLVNCVCTQRPRFQVRVHPSYILMDAGLFPPTKLITADLLDQ